MHKVDQRRGRPDRIVEVFWIGNNDLFKINDVRDEGGVDQEERYEYEVTVPTPQRAEVRGTRIRGDHPPVRGRTTS